MKFDVVRPGTPCFGYGTEEMCKSAPKDLFPVQLPASSVTLTIFPSQKTAQHLLNLTGEIRSSWTIN